MTASLDESKDRQEKRTFVLAGYVSRDESRDRLWTKKWSRLLKTSANPKCHASDCERGSRRFFGMSKIQREFIRLLSDSESGLVAHLSVIKLEPHTVELAQDPTKRRSRRESITDSAPLFIVAARAYGARVQGEMRGEAGGRAEGFLVGDTNGRVRGRVLGGAHAWLLVLRLHGIDVSEEPRLPSQSLPQGLSRFVYIEPLRLVFFLERAGQNLRRRTKVAHSRLPAVEKTHTSIDL